MSKQRARRGCCHQLSPFHHYYIVLQPYFAHIYKELKAETGYESAELWEIDLAQVSSVINFTERFEKEGGRLDILLENAGILPIPGQQLTVDGYEPVLVIYAYTV